MGYLGLTQLLDENTEAPDALETAHGLVLWVLLKGTQQESTHLTVRTACSFRVV